jgi:hypothetical protein
MGDAAAIELTLTPTSQVTRPTKTSTPDRAMSTGAADERLHASSTARVQIDDLKAAPGRVLGSTSTSADPQPPSGATSAAMGQPLSKTLSGEDAGSPLDDAEVLRQIARCLPAGLRPSLSGARLIIDVDDAGALRAPPRFEFGGLFHSKEETLQADHVVQAALQCGPYTDPVARGRTLALAVDFAGTRDSHAASK